MLFLCSPRNYKGELWDRSSWSPPAWHMERLITPSVIFHQWVSDAGELSTNLKDNLEGHRSFHPFPPFVPAFGIDVFIASMEFGRIRSVSFLAKEWRANHS